VREVFKYGYIGKCTRYGEHGVRVENTIYNILMCRGCRYFLGNVGTSGAPSGATRV
jgi:hypothetical protein